MEIPVPVQSSCMTLGKLQSSHVQNRDNNISYLKIIVRIK